jgi:hypothetical protein
MTEANKVKAKIPTDKEMEANGATGFDVFDKGGMVVGQLLYVAAKTGAGRSSYSDDDYDGSPSSTP